MADFENVENSCFTSWDCIVAQEDTIDGDEVINIIDDNDLPSVNHDSRFKFCKIADNDDQFMEIEDSDESAPKISPKKQRQKINIAFKSKVSKFGSESKQENISFYQTMMYEKKPIVNNKPKTSVAEKKLVNVKEEIKRKAEDVAENVVAKKPKVKKPILWTNVMDKIVDPVESEELAKIDMIQHDVRNLYEVEKYEHLKKPVKSYRRR